MNKPAGFMSDTSGKIVKLESVKELSAASLI